MFFFMWFFNRDDWNFFSKMLYLGVEMCNFIIIDFEIVKYFF